jgi:hypothetical protein
MIHDTLVPDHVYTVLSLPPISAWALLFAGKDVENRALATSQRGRVLIHASCEAMSLRESQARRAELSFLSGLSLSSLPTIFARGTILGSLAIIDCVTDARSKWAVSGKYHWLVRDPRPLLMPIEDIEGEPEFWQWTNARKPARAGRQRTVVRSGIVPALKASEVAASRIETPLARRRRGS